MSSGPDRGADSGLKGWLSDVYLPALIAGQADALATRLGDRAAVDDPIFGRAAGMPVLGRFLAEIAAWLAKHSAAFERVGFVTGSDRDVTEGVLTLEVEGRRVRVPVAVVAERRREREVELRLYYSTRPIRGTRAVRSPLLPKDDEVAVPPPVSAYLDALARGDAAAVVASFEAGGALRDSAGATHVNDDAGALRAYHERQFAPIGGRPGGIRVLKGARADDGRTCALEYTVVRVHDRDVPPQAGLAVYERGQSGLLRTLRVYEDVYE
jgi:hypothetical protein